MRLYPKKLKNVDDLNKEKKRLLKKAKELDKEDILSFDGLLGKKGKDEDGGGVMSSIIDMLPIGNPLVKMGVKMAQRFLLKKKGSTGESIADKAKKKGKSALRTATIEILGGYLKWKAIQLSYKGISNIIKKRRADEKHEEQMHNL